MKFKNVDIAVQAERCHGGHMCLHGYQAVTRFSVAGDHKLTIFGGVACYLYLDALGSAQMEANRMTWLAGVFEGKFTLGPSVSFNSLQNQKLAHLPNDPAVMDLIEAGIVNSTELWFIGQYLAEVPADWDQPIKQKSKAA